MQYLGGKSGEGKRIAEVCTAKLKTGSLFVDMFCGSLNVVRHVKHPHRLAVDACEPLIIMWRAALDGWVPPRTVSRDEYDYISKMQNPHDPMTAFVLFGVSFGGKWRGGYAKDRPEQRYAECCIPDSITIMTVGAKDPVAIRTVAELAHSKMTSAITIANQTIVLGGRRAGKNEQSRILRYLRGEVDAL